MGRLKACKIIAWGEALGIVSVRLGSPVGAPENRSSGMPQSLAKVILHIVFSTKNRQPVIVAEMRDDLASYIAGTLKELDSPPIEVRCVADHVHILCHLSKSRSISGVLKEVKQSSSTWVKEKWPKMQDFYWQRGYVVSSVSRSNIEAVRSYIDHQEEHHRKRTFKEEFLEFLKRHEIPYDERYVWD